MQRDEKREEGKRKRRIERRGDAVFTAFNNKLEQKHPKEGSSY